MDALKTMSITKLRDLRSEVDAAISERVTARRRDLATRWSLTKDELADIDRLCALAGVTAGARSGRTASFRLGAGELDDLAPLLDLLDDEFCEVSG
jgi:hypothetical protein